MSLFYIILINTSENLHARDTVYKGVAKFQYLDYTVTGINSRDEGSESPSMACCSTQSVQAS